MIFPSAHIVGACLMTEGTRKFKASVANLPRYHLEESFVDLERAFAVGYFFFGGETVERELTGNMLKPQSDRFSKPLETVQKLGSKDPTSSGTTLISPGSIVGS